jgi:mannose-6-phosphate isomerase-like protein (cupin superfamily)
MNKYTEQRPWGNFERFTHNEISTVKILNFQPNSAISLQLHHNRDEFWRIISGSGIVRLGGIDHPAKVGDEFFIPKETKHRLTSGNSSMQVLEISFGNFDETDEIRLEDNYNRAEK